MNILLLIAGIALLVWGVLLIIKNIKLVKNGIKMQADIVEVKHKQQTDTDSDGYTTTTDMYYPVFKYNYNGEEYIKESDFGVSNKKKYVQGAKLDILFMSDKPDKPKVKTVMNIWLMPALLSFLGIIFLISSFFV